MSRLYVDAKIIGERSLTKRVLVDTGADRTMISASLAKKLKLTPVGRTIQMKLPNKKVLSAELHYARIEINGYDADIVVGVGQVGEGIILGHDVLEGINGEFTIENEKLFLKNKYERRL